MGVSELCVWKVVVKKEKRVKRKWAPFSNPMSSLVQVFESDLG